MRAVGGLIGAVLLVDLVVVVGVFDDQAERSSAPCADIHLDVHPERALPADLALMVPAEVPGLPRARVGARWPGPMDLDAAADLRETGKPSEPELGRLRSCGFRRGYRQDYATPDRATFAHVILLEFESSESAAGYVDAIRQLQAPLGGGFIELPGHPEAVAWETPLDGGDGWVVNLLYSVDQLVVREAFAYRSGRVPPSALATLDEPVRAHLDASRVSSS